VVIHIAVYADVLAPPTTAAPMREILLQLMRQRCGDHFTYWLCRGSQQTIWWREFRSRIATSVSFDEAVLPWSRRSYNMRTLLGEHFLPRTSAGADIYLRLDAGTMGPKGVPLINLVTDLSSLKGARCSSMSWAGRRIYRRLLRESGLANRTVCISGATARDVANLVPEMEGRISVICNGIADEWLAPITLGERNLGAASRPYFIWYGFISPRKNILRLLLGYAEATRKADGPFPDLLLVGDSPAGQSPLDKKIKGLGLEGNVRRLPPQPLDVIIKLVSESNGLVFPSLIEGFGMPIIEAYARGIPVLTSNVTSMPEVAGGLSDLCDPEDTASIAEGLLRLAHPARMLPEFIAKRRSYAEGFSAQRAAATYSGLIDEVLSERRPKSFTSNERTVPNGLLKSA
jgi:glycosyltransferase involved in cell wall biosynthesis